MKATRHCEGQIIAILKQSEAELTMREITVTPLSSARRAGESRLHGSCKVKRNCLLEGRRAV